MITDESALIKWILLFITKFFFSCCVSVVSNSNRHNRMERPSRKFNFLPRRKNKSYIYFNRVSMSNGIISFCDIQEKVYQNMLQQAFSKIQKCCILMSNTLFTAEMINLL